MDFEAVIPLFFHLCFWYGCDEWNNPCTYTLYLVTTQYLVLRSNASSYGIATAGLWNNVSDSSFHHISLSFISSIRSLWFTLHSGLGNAASQQYNGSNEFWVLTRFLSACTRDSGQCKNTGGLVTICIHRERCNKRLRSGRWHALGTIRETQRLFTTTSSAAQRTIAPPAYDNFPCETL